MGTEERGTVARLLSGQGRGKEDGHRRAGNSGPPGSRVLWADPTSESFRDSQEPPGLELSCCRQPPDGKGEIIQQPSIYQQLLCSRGQRWQ